MSKNKYKIVKNSRIKQFILSSHKGQQLSVREAVMLGKGEINGLIAIDIRHKHSTFDIIYNVTGLTTLRNFLKCPLNKDTFARLLRNILAVLKNIESEFFNPKNLLADFDRVMVNTSTMQLWFMYVPIQDYDTGYSLRNFLLGIIEVSVFNVEEDNEYIKQYIRILNSGINFSLFELEQYIESILDIKSQFESDMVTCPVCNTRQSKENYYCRHCRAKLFPIAENSEELIYDPINNIDKYSVDEDQSNNKNKTTDSKVSDIIHNNKKIYNIDASTDSLSEGTTVLDTDIKGTTILITSENSIVTNPYLIRLNNGEKIEINKPTFRIGKEKSNCDYIVYDNGSVSRSHADIITRYNHYYIVDLNSTNGTYINGMAIPVEKEFEIKNGTSIKLANEKFNFYI